MEQSNRDRMFELIQLLNRYRYEYYDLHAPTVSDEQYDKLYCELVGLQSELMIYMANSPSVYPGYPPVDKLITARSLLPMQPEVTTEIAQLMAFQMQKQLIFMPLLKGIPVQLTYENCELKEMSTRTSGREGYVVTHNVCSIAGVPLVFNRKQRLVVSGVIFMEQKVFDVLSQSLVNKKGLRYTDIKEMVHDAVHLLDPRLCRKCQLHLMVTEVLEGFEQIPTKAQRMGMLLQYGFSPCRHLVTNRPLSQSQIREGFDRILADCSQCDIPVDGSILLYNDVLFSTKCGTSGYPSADRLAFRRSRQQSSCSNVA